MDHINRDRFDNRPENLRWATKKEQVRNRSTVRTVHGYVLNTEISLGIWLTITDAAVKIQRIFKVHIDKALDWLSEEGEKAVVKPK